MGCPISSRKCVDFSVPDVRALNYMVDVSKVSFTLMSEEAMSHANPSGSIAQSSEVLTCSKSSKSGHSAWNLNVES